MQDNGKKLGIGSVVKWKTVNGYETGTIIGKHNARHALIQMKDGRHMLLAKHNIKEIL